MKNAIEIRGLIRRYSSFTLGPVDLDLPAGTVLGLIGENGAGKTTLLRSILSAAAADAGTIHVMGTDNRDPSFTELKNRIGAIPDAPCFPANLSGRQIEKIMSMFFRDWDDRIFNAYAEKFRLPLGQEFSEYSKGTAAKLNIACALSHHPDLLIMDEPTSGLDPVVRDEVLDVFNNFARDENHAVLISTHILSDLEKICDYIAFLHEGQILFCQPKDELLDSHVIVKWDSQEHPEIGGLGFVTIKEGSYGNEGLLLRSALPQALPPGIITERATIEAIMIFTARAAGKR